MRKFFSLVIFFSTISFYVCAEKVNNISITGNERVSEETIKVYGGIEIGKNYSEADLNEILRKLYETNFFENVKINLENQTLLINVNEHPIINQLTHQVYLKAFLF